MRMIVLTMLAFESCVLRSKYSMWGAFIETSRLMRVRRHRMATIAYLQCVFGSLAIPRTVSVYNGVSIVRVAVIDNLPSSRPPRQ